MRWALVWMCAGLAWAQHDVVPADIEEGARNFAAACAVCHGPDGNAMSDADLSKPTLRRATTDDQIASIVLSGIPGTAMPPNSLNQRQVFTVVAYIRSLSKLSVQAAVAGNATRGKTVFEGKGQCLTCHRVGERGSYSGPNLSDIGILRRASELEASLVNPAAEVLSQNSTVIATTKEGATIRGILLNVDTHYLQIVEPNGQLRNLAKDSLQSYTQEMRTSPMPSYRDRLTKDELTDVVKYLTTLRGN